MVTIEVLDNDINVVPGTLELNSRPEHGTVLLTVDGFFVYEPFPNYAGKDDFTYSAAGPDGGISLASVEVSVLSVNDAPIVSDAEVSITEDGSFVIDLRRLVADADGDALVLAWVTDGVSGSTTDLGDGRVRYRPDPDYFGADSFSFEWCDPSGSCAVGTISVTVGPANDVVLAAPTIAGTGSMIWFMPESTTGAGTALVTGVVTRVVGAAAVPAAVLALVLAGSLGVGIEPGFGAMIERLLARRS
ncbi:MAG: tandem-95 repeat protein [Acidimicrobiia bacterium]|nr:tandem-95 repeat protein [Acidimicrobiia bacterium]